MDKIMRGRVNSRAYSYCEDQTVPTFPNDKPIFVYDGMCGLCSGWVAFLLKRDKHKTLRFLSAQSDIGQALYRHCDLNPVDFETNFLIEDGWIYQKTAASLKTTALLGGAWRLVLVFQICPNFLTDRVYELIAKNRFKFAGRRGFCYGPPPNYGERFIVDTK